jgi:hypothetical protein
MNFRQANTHTNIMKVFLIFEEKSQKCKTNVFSKRENEWCSFGVEEGKEVQKVL